MHLESCDVSQDGVKLLRTSYPVYIKLAIHHSLPRKSGIWRWLHRSATSYIHKKYWIDENTFQPLDNVFNIMLRGSLSSGLDYESIRLNSLILVRIDLSDNSKDGDIAKSTLNEGFP